MVMHEAHAAACTLLCYRLVALVHDSSKDAWSPQAPAPALACLFCRAQQLACAGMGPSCMHGQQATE